MFYPNIETLFEDLTGGDQIINSDALMYWSPEAQQYVSGYKYIDGKFYTDFTTFTPFTFTVQPHSGFWVANNQLEGKALYVSGKVILDNTYNTQILKDMNLLMVPFLSDTSIQDMALSQQGTGADSQGG